MTAARGHSPVLTFLGATGTVTGSRFLVETARASVLVDCGLYQGLRDLRRRNWSPLTFSPGGVDAVVLTHAHLDHCGYLPALVARGFRGRILATPGTVALAGIVLRDSARLQEEDAEYAARAGFSKHTPPQPLYTVDDAEAAIKLLEAVPFGTEREAAPGVTVTMQPAGHVLGSASATLTVDGQRMTASGDLGRDTHPLLTAPPPPPETQTLLVESTYGDREHDDSTPARMAAAIRTTLERGGSVVIPAFAVDRTEIVLHELRRLMAVGQVPRVPVFADSPMALATLDVYRAAIAHRSAELRAGLDAGGDPFDPGELHEARTVEESKRIDGLSYPCIIVSASGMATGGRVLHHLARMLPDPANSVLLVGFQAAGTRGRALLDGAREVKMLGRYVPVRADVVDVTGMSAHADASELMAWLSRAEEPPRACYVVHGEPQSSETLRARIAAELGWTAIVPGHGERVRLD